MNLFVGNLNPSTTAISLDKLFSEFGGIVSAKVIMDNATGMSRGFGFVEMADKQHAINAIDNLDATYFEGNIISVKEAKQNNTTKPSGGSYNQRGSSGGGSRPYNNNRPSYNNNRPAYNNNRPSYDNNRPSYDRPSSDRPSSYDKPRTYQPRQNDDADDKFNRL